VLASRKTDDPKGYLGVVPNQLEIRRSTWSAPIVAVGFTKQLVVLTFKGLGHALAGLGSIIAGGLTGNKQARQNGQTAASSQVGGPVAIMAVLWGAGTLGIVFILMIIAIISLTLALMNILPLPALDGGRLFVTLTSRAILKRPLSRQAEELVHGTGMAVLLLLVALITIVDVKRFF
jgi:regulator of sigma E protease